MSGLFAKWQPRYAEVGIAILPATNKIPAVKNYTRMGIRASSALVAKFGDVDCFGMVCGRHSGITVVDIDSTDEADLQWALDEFGTTPIIARSGRGGFHAWYRYAGEPRRQKAYEGRPIDLLGAGFALAPPARTGKGIYQFIEGSLEDVASLKPMERTRSHPGLTSGTVADGAAHAPSGTAEVRKGRRNDALFRHCMVEAPTCSNLDEVLKVAQTFNTRCDTPLPATEVVKTAGSAWKIQQEGRNFIGSGRVLVIPRKHVDDVMMQEPDAFLLLVLLSKEHLGRRDHFFVGNEMATIMPKGGWRRQRFAAARKVLVEMGYLAIVQKPRNVEGGAGVYSFNSPRL